MSLLFIRVETMCVRVQQGVWIDWEESNNYGLTDPFVAL